MSDDFHMPNFSQKKLPEITDAMLSEQYLSISDTLNGIRRSIAQLSLENIALRRVLKEIVDADFLVDLEVYHRCKALFPKAPK